MSKPTTQTIAKALRDVGVISEDEYNDSLRIVIVLDPREQPRIFTERILNDKFLDVGLSLAGIEIVDRPNDSWVKLRGLIDKMAKQAKRYGNIGSYAAAKKILELMDKGVIDEDELPDVPEDEEV